MKKKFLAMVLSLSMVLPTSVMAFATEVEDLEKPDSVVTESEENEQTGELQIFLENYFFELYDTIRADSQKDYSSSDFSSVRGYIVAKWLVNKRRVGLAYYGGIVDVAVDQVEIDDLSEVGGAIEAMVYVHYSYRRANATEASLAGVLYRVTLSNTDSGYQVLDLDNQDIEVLMVKAAVFGKDDVLDVLETDRDSVPMSENADTGEEKEMECAAVDQYYEQQEKNTESMLQCTSFAEPQEDAEKEISPLSTKVSYKERKARNWGYKLGDNKENYIFQRATLDCTNFVSQCIWAGYGGTEDYTIPASPSVGNATCIALKNRVKADYRMTKSWYGRNYDSTLGNPPTAFCGVEGLYNYVSSNTGDGPKATVYNNEQPFSSLSVKFKQGDVLQFATSSGRYGHSVIVVSDTPYAVSDYKNVTVAQHQYDDNDRALSELVDSYGGTSCKMRLLRFNSTTF